MAKQRHKTPEERAFELISAKCGKYVTYSKFIQTQQKFTNRTTPESSFTMVNSSYLSSLKHIPAESWYIMYLYICQPLGQPNFGYRALALIASMAQIPTSDWYSLYPGQRYPLLSDVPPLIAQIPQTDWCQMWDHTQKPKKGFGKG